MTMFHKCIKAYQHLHISKTWFSACSLKWNVEFAFFSNKVDIPSPPKRPLSAYMIFCRENRKHILKENPSLSSPEQIKRLAQQWNGLDDEMKKPYEIVARKNILQYGEAHKKYYESLTEEQKDMLAKLKTEKKESRRTLKLKRSLRESGMPKLPGSAYSFYVHSQAKDKGDMKHPSVSEFMREVGEKWRNLSEDEKKQFEEQARQSKQQYMIELKEWRNKLEKEGNFELLKAYDEMKSKGKSAVSDDLSLPTSKAVKDVVSGTVSKKRSTKDLSLSKN